MADLVVIVGVIVFFAISMLYVVGCDRIIGPDADAESTGPDDAALAEVEAMARVER